MTDDNRVTVAGTVCRNPDAGRTPAGIPLTRFTLEHRSRRDIDGKPRETRFRIVVAAAGSGLGTAAARLVAGDRVRVSGYLSRSDSRKDERHVTLHAENLERLPETGQHGH